ncbi:hypothetical protein [Caudoviricetes sp.]|nr:hypothetical protein [Caudoviricetes sp.]
MGFEPMTPRLQTSGPECRNVVGDSRLEQGRPRGDRQRVPWV